MRGPKGLLQKLFQIQVCSHNRRCASMRVRGLQANMQVPMLARGSAAIAPAVSPPGSYVDLRVECATLAVLSNCRQTHKPCNGYKPTPSSAQYQANFKLGAHA